MTKTVNVNSSKNQDIKGKFVSREVLSCVTGMVEYIIKQGFEDREAPFSLDDCSNYYTDNSGKIEELTEKKEQLEEEIQDIENSIEELEDEDGNKDEEIQTKENEKNKLEEKISSIENKIEELEEEQGEVNEPYEWWIVSSWLCDKLKEKGEVVLEDENIWGRQTSGQAILLDSVISEICSDMGILEGQEHEW